MSAEKAREGYRRRLNKDDVVYFVEGENIIGDGDLTVKKASVAATIISPSGYERRYPIVTPWDEVDKPKDYGTCVGMSPRELFTPTEVTRIITNDDGPLGLDRRPIDEILVDPASRQELTILLGAAVIQRMADDEAYKPNDPEYI